ncbi:hypothetical protein Tco_0339438 [Tanacetum coccineum]
MGTAITNDSTRSSKLGEERFQEFHHNSGIVSGEHFCFNPFRQVVNGYENVLIPLRRREWPYEIDAPYVKDLAYLNCILGHLIFLIDFALTLTRVTPCDHVMGISVNSRPYLSWSRRIEMEKRNIQDRNVLSIDHHRAFRKINDLESFKAPMRWKMRRFLLIRSKNTMIENFVLIFR